MKKRLAGLAMVAALVGLAAPESQAQLTPSPQGPFAALSQVYRLDKGSAFSEGCLPPCLCPIWFTGDVRGTFVLQLQTVSQFARTYSVEDVNWTVVKLDGTEMRVTGKGTYIQHVPGVLTVLPTHHLALELSIDGAAPVKFDSGTVTDPDTGPKIDIAIADADFFCYNRVFDIVASPVPNVEITNYSLLRGSYHEGCYAPCLCPIAGPMRVVGTFQLVPLEQNGTIEHYAVVNADWQIWNYLGAKSTTVEGYGTLTRISGFAGWWNRMELELSIGGAAFEHFDSGGANETVPFPALLQELSMNGKVCYDKVFKFMAKPIVALPTPIFAIG